MIPVIALVGRPNVGKSTLFNRLTRTRDALVAAFPGLTRDRQYGKGAIGDFPYIVVDTGGLTGEDEGIDRPMAGQVQQAIDEANLVLFMVDSREGRTPGDETIADNLREIHAPVVLVANKIDGQNPDFVAAEFYALGFGDPAFISATNGHGVTRLVEERIRESIEIEEAPAAGGEHEGIRMAVVGRPNVGKSTLVNRLLGEERVVVFDEAGTTRDSIYIPFERDGKRYTIIDTAGVRRRGKVTRKIEKFSVVKTLEAIERSNVVILMIDARDGIVEQDLHLLGHVLEAGRALVLAVNKWDGMSQDDRAWLKRELERRLTFIDFVKIHFISALHGSGVGDLYESIHRAYDSATCRAPTHVLNEILAAAVQEHHPPLVRGRRIKLRYAHMGGSNPPLIVVHGNQTGSVPDSYRRFLQHRFAEALKLEGTPVRVEFRSGENPYEGRRNRLTERQVARKRRLMSHVKRQKKRKR